MRTFTTEEIAKATGGVASGHAEVTSVVIDNREARPGSLFIAIKGERLDGHQFIDSAVEAGATAVLCHKDVSCKVPTVKVADTTKAFLDLAKSYRLEYDIPVVALTGSVGKTTTKEMIWCVLNAKYHAHKTYKNWNNEIGLPKVLLRLEPEHTALVLELGMNHKGEISTLSKTALPDIGVITNVGVSHIENLGSREGILAAKLELLDGTVVSDRGRCKVELPTTGEHNVYDALAAIGVGLELEIPLEDAAAALKQYRPAGMRENVVEKGGVTVIEDCYNASPDSMKAMAETLMLKGAPGRRKIAIIGDMLELGDYSEEAHALAGQYMAEAGVDLLITYGPMSKFAAQSAREHGLLRVFDFQDKADLTSKLTGMLKPGDVVAVKGSRGMQMEEIIQNIYDNLDD